MSDYKDVLYYVTPPDQKVKYDLLRQLASAMSTAGIGGVSIGQDFGNGFELIVESDKFKATFKGDIKLL